jgi:hypothetical protein
MNETKANRNARVQHRWDELMQEGKHGHYETLFRVVREEVEAERMRVVYAVRDIAGLETAMKVMDATVMPDFVP